MISLRRALLALSAIALFPVASKMFQNDGVPARLPLDAAHAAAISSASSTASPEDYRSWQATRVERLRAENGWLSLVGLHWIEPGKHSLGSAKRSGIRLAAGPAKLGSLELDASTREVRFTPARAVNINGKAAVIGQTVVLNSDKDGTQSEVSAGALSFILIDRSQRLALRVRNNEAKTRTQFQGIDYFPYDANFKVVAKYTPYATPRVIDVATIVGTVEPTPNPGKVSFQLQGQSFTLELLEGADSGSFFTVFGDQTNGKESYGMARFLVGTMDAKNQTAELDFNRAYNPPCAFTEFATCPMPPEGNRIRLAVRAGEKKYRGHP